MKKRSKIDKAISRAICKAIYKYNMIVQDDRIIVGVSGGKDSLTLLYMLWAMRTRSPIDYKLFPVYIDPGFGGKFNEKLIDFCAQIGLQLKIDYTDHGILAHNEENRENPCFLCSMLRRRRLFEIADEYGCSKVAFGHNKDDIIETVFLNMFYSGQISTMVPAQSLFNDSLTVIRPLAFVEKSNIEKFASLLDFPVIKNLCPSAGHTKREEVKKFLNFVYADNKHIKSSIFNALSNVRTEYLLK